MESGRREMTGGTQKSIKRKRKERVFGISGWVGQIPATGFWSVRRTVLLLLRYELATHVLFAFEN